MDKASEEAKWLRHFLIDVPLWPKPVHVVSIHCDSQAAISRAQNSNYNWKSRHIRMRHNTMRQLLKDGIIAINIVRSTENLADPFTKGLAKELVHKTSRGMGLKPKEI